jgi:nitroreductase
MNGSSSSEGLPEQQSRADQVVPSRAVAVGADAPIIEVMRTTRAMRHLAPDPVPRDRIRAVIEAGTWGPSGANAQPANYVVVTDKETMARLAPLWGRVIDDYRFAMASSGALQRSGPSHELMRASIEYQRAHFAETPALIVVCEDARALGVVRGTIGTLWTMVRRGGVRRALRIIRAYPHFRRSDAAFYYPAAENILLAARAYGLAACFTSWHLFAEDEFKRVIGIPEDVRTWAIIPIGYPLKRFGPVNRRPVDEVIRWETW